VTFSRILFYGVSYEHVSVVLATVFLYKWSYNSTHSLSSLYLWAYKILDQTKLIRCIRKEWRIYSNFWSPISTSLCLWLYSPLDLGRFFSSLILYTIGRTPWTGDQVVARPLPTQRTTQTQNNRTDIYVSSGIGTQDPSVRADKDGSCLRSRGHRDRLLISTYKVWISSVNI
jgi:hypothetical protein